MSQRQKELNSIFIELERIFYNEADPKTKSDDKWTVTVPGIDKGTLELIGVDIGMRNQLEMEVPANTPLVFTGSSARPTTAGYVMVQYRNERKEVKDVVLIKTGF